MKNALLCLAAGSIAAANVSAEVITIDSGNASGAYDTLVGFVVDVDTTYNSSAPTHSTGWQGSLVAGQQYRIDSISLWEYSDTSTANENNDTPVYLSVYDYEAWDANGGFNGSAGTTHLKHSDNAIAHTDTVDGTKITYTFTDLTVTAGSDGWLGDGSLLFSWDDDTTANNYGSQGIHGLARVNADTATYGAAVMGQGSWLRTDRVTDIEITVTAIPEPATLGLIAIFGGSVLFIRRRFII